MKKPLLIIFAIALAIRFWHFPENIYFGFDQARDAFESINIYKNFDFKIVGPSTAEPNLFHGPMYWYLMGPLYLIGGGNPTFPAAFMRIYNAFGVFLIFWLGKTLFNKRVGLVAALIFAISFEQTQYSIYFHHPPLAVLTIMLFYGGLALAIFRNNGKGLPLSLLGLGLSIQSEFQLPYLGVIFIFVFFLFKKELLSLIKPKVVFCSFLALFVTLSTFILAELKYGFRSVKTMFAMLNGVGNKNIVYAISTYIGRLALQVHDNVFGFGGAKFLLALFLAGMTYFIMKKKNDYNKLKFLLIWFLSTSVLILFGPIKLYYTFVGISPSIILVASFFISKLWETKKELAFLALVLIVVSNFLLIKKQNHLGVINDIQVQEGMLLGREISALDFIYEESGDLPIVVSASTSPLKINTTWAYLFNWYGKGKYGKVPYWAGEAAQGYPGELPAWVSQEENYAFFSIIEPRRGVRDAFVEEFLQEQEQYGKVKKERVSGDKVYNKLIVQKRTN